MHTHHTRHTHASHVHTHDTRYAHMYTFVHIVDVRATLQNFITIGYMMQILQIIFFGLGNVLTPMDPIEYGYQHSESTPRGGRNSCKANLMTIDAELKLNCNILSVTKECSRIPGEGLWINSPRFL